MLTHDDVTRRRGSKVPARQAQQLAAAMTAYEKAEPYLEALPPIERERYMDWTPQAFLRHMERRTPRPGKPPRHTRARAPRSRALTRRARPRAPDDDGPEPPPATAGPRYNLTCHACGSEFGSARPHTRTCSHRCRQRLYVQSRSAEASLCHLGDIAWQLVAAGELSPVEALGLIIWPSEQLQQALAEVTA